MPLIASVVLPLSENDDKLSQSDRIRQVFNLFDLDGDGFITTDELRTVLKGLGQEYAEDEIKDIVASMDCDGTGSIDFDEFEKFVTLQSKGLKEVDEITEAFRMFDRDGSGYISSTELKYALKTLCTKMNPSEEEIQAIVLEADCNGDGQISYEEFAKMLSTKNNP